MITFLQWSSELSVGIDFIDADHQKLMELLTELHALSGPGQDPQLAVAKLDELIDFTQQHFRLEERLMEENDYEDYEEHRQTHELLLQEIGELRQQLAGGERKAGQETMTFLKHWLIRHILESDKDLGGFLERRVGRHKDA